MVKPIPNNIFARVATRAPALEAVEAAEVLEAGASSFRLGRAFGIAGLALAAVGTGIWAYRNRETINKWIHPDDIKGPTEDEKKEMFLQHYAKQLADIYKIPLDQAYMQVGLDYQGNLPGKLVESPRANGLITQASVGGIPSTSGAALSPKERDELIQYLRSLRGPLNQLQSQPGFPHEMIGIVARRQKVQGEGEISAIPSQLTEALRAVQGSVAETLETALTDPELNVKANAIVEALERNNLTAAKPVFNIAFPQDPFVPTFPNPAEATSVDIDQCEALLNNLTPQNYQDKNAGVHEERRRAVGNFLHEVTASTADVALARRVFSLEMNNILSDFTLVFPAFPTDLLERNISLAGSVEIEDLVRQAGHGLDFRFMRFVETPTVIDQALGETERRTDKSDRVATDAEKALHLLYRIATEHRDASTRLMAAESLMRLHATQETSPLAVALIKANLIGLTRDIEGLARAGETGVPMRSIADRLAAMITQIQDNGIRYQASILLQRVLSVLDANNSSDPDLIWQMIEVQVVWNNIDKQPALSTLNELRPVSDEEKRGVIQTLVTRFLVAGGDTARLLGHRSPYVRFLALEHDAMTAFPIDEYWGGVYLQQIARLSFHDALSPLPWVRREVPLVLELMVQASGFDLSMAERNLESMSKNRDSILAKAAQESVQNIAAARVELHRESVAERAAAANLDRELSDLPEPSSVDLNGLSLVRMEVAGLKQVTMMTFPSASEDPDLKDLVSSTNDRVRAIFNWLHHVVLQNQDADVHYQAGVLFAYVVEMLDGDYGSSVDAARKEIEVQSTLDNSADELEALVQRFLLVGGDVSELMQSPFPQVRFFGIRHYGSDVLLHLDGEDFLGEMLKSEETNLKRDLKSPSPAIRRQVPLELRLMIQTDGSALPAAESLLEGLRHSNDPVVSQAAEANIQALAEARAQREHSEPEIYVYTVAAPKPWVNVGPLLEGIEKYRKGNLAVDDLAKLRRDLMRLASGGSDNPATQAAKEMLQQLAEIERAKHK